MTTSDSSFMRTQFLIALLAGGGLSPALAQFNLSGACCTSDGGCSVINGLTCLGQGDTFLGVDTTCSPGACAGACCHPDGTCTDGDAPPCFSSLGEFLGVGTTCATATCRDTSFTYQGRLEDAGAPADGIYDLRFRLFDAAIGGVQVGPTLCADNQDVMNGLFTSNLNFGHLFATTAERHLEIDVRADTGLNCANAAGFVVLAPRQRLSPIPKAIHAHSASALDASDGSPQNAVFVDADGNVGIGTTAPSSKLDVIGPMVIVSEGDQADALWLGIERSWVFRQQGTGAGTALKLQSVGGGGNKNFLIQTDGFVGIGTTAPAAKLDVRGDIKSGPNGEFFAASGGENLRIVRGLVNENGPDQGSGFSISHPEIGNYTITFHPPFSAVPVVVASVQSNFLGTKAIALVDVHSSSAASVLILGNTANVPFDVDFSFVAVGPR